MTKQGMETTLRSRKKSDLPTDYDTHIGYQLNVTKQLYQSHNPDWQKEYSKLRAMLAKLPLLDRSKWLERVMGVPSIGSLSQSTNATSEKIRCPYLMWSVRGFMVCEVKK